MSSLTVEQRVVLERIRHALRPQIRLPVIAFEVLYGRDVLDQLTLDALQGIDPSSTTLDPEVRRDLLTLRAMGLVHD